MRSLILLICCICCLSQLSTAQGNIFIEEDENIRRMLDMRKELNFKKDRFVRAWSIQLLVTRDKFLVNQKKDEFSKQYRDIHLDWEYEQPYYRLNVGAFYTKLEATMALHKFIEKYPDAYVFKNSQAKPSDF